jgi:hypothetical protein
MISGMLLMLMTLSSGVESNCRRENSFRLNCRAREARRRDGWMRDTKRRHGTWRTPAPVDQSFPERFLRKTALGIALPSAGCSWSRTTRFCPIPGEGANRPSLATTFCPCPSVLAVGLHNFRAMHRHGYCADTVNTVEPVLECEVIQRGPARKPGKSGALM